MPRLRELKNKVFNNTTKRYENNNFEILARTHGACFHDPVKRLFERRDATSNPVFPQVQTIAGNAGDEFDFTFKANENWSLASSAIWCKMVQGEEGKEAFVLNGTAGKQTIKVKLTDDDASKNKTVAQLFLNMGGQKVAIAEIVRSADGYELEVCDEKATLSTRL